MQLVMNLFLPCSLLIGFFHDAGAASLDGAASRQLRRSQSDDKAKQIPIPLPEQPKRKKRVMDAIQQFRAEICYKMKKEHGIEFASFEACEKFMTDACEPGRDKQMDGDRKEVTSEKGYCKEYFPEAKRKAEEKVDKEDKEEEEKKKVVPVAPAPSPFPAPVPAPEKAVPAPAPQTVAGAPGPAPSPGPMSVPGPAPVPAPFIPGVSGGKPWGPIADDEKYYFKKGGKDAGRLHMSSDLKLPTQGYWGKLVEHEDQKTFTGDWGHEFGPGSGHESFEAICAEHPDNPWCTDQGYHQHKSSCPAMSGHLLALVCAFVFMGAF